MKIYHDMLQKILDHGQDRPDRTGTGTRALFGETLRFDLQQGFPAVTTKKLAWKACVSELLWFIEGSGDERRLREILHGDRNSIRRTIWTDNAEAGYWKERAKFDGDLGRVYGMQWRKWQKPARRGFPGVIDALLGRVEYVDQLHELVHGLETNPFSRRHILTAWNPGELDVMALPPCHMFSQFFVGGDGKLSCQMYQRSVDTFLGLPFNIASYALLTHMLAQVCDLAVGELVWVGGDCHIYYNHFDQVREQLSREEFPMPTLKIDPLVRRIEAFTMGSFELEGYVSHEAIRAKMAV